MSQPRSSGALTTLHVRACYRLSASRRSSDRWSECDIAKVNGPGWSEVWRTSARAWCGAYGDLREVCRRDDFTTRSGWFADGKGATIRITFRDARKGVRELDLTDEEAEKLGGWQCRTTCKPYFLNSERSRRNPFMTRPRYYRLRATAASSGRCVRTDPPAPGKPVTTVL